MSDRYLQRTYQDCILQFCPNVRLCIVLLYTICGSCLLQVAALVECTIKT